MSSELTEKTRLPFSLVATFIAAAIGGTVWVQSTLFEIRTEVRVMASDLASLKSSVANGANDVFTLTDMRRWVQLARAQNPTIAIPDAK